MLQLMCEAKNCIHPFCVQAWGGAANIRHALVLPEYEGPLENDGDKRIVIGFDLNGNLLEILYNQIGDETDKVFHAMKCRNIFYHLLNH
jgi:hypothetical protein